jgi:hypothetical protein
MADVTHTILRGGVKKSKPPRREVCAQGRIVVAEQELSWCGKEVASWVLRGLVMCFGKKEGKIMRSIAWFLVAASLLVFTGLGLSAVQAAEQKQATADQKQTTDQKQGQGQDQWRYARHNGEWWYWLPANRWVYWRDSRWNTYDPKTFTYPNATGVVATSRNGSTDGSRAASNSDIRPFYGHAESNLDRRPLEANNEVGPFYGHALPSEVFGGWRARRSIRPFYGHAVSSYSD